MSEFSRRRLDQHDEAILGRRQKEIASALARASRTAGLFVANGLEVPFDLLPEPEGDPSTGRLLELAREEWAAIEYWAVVAFANGVLRADDATISQRAEALRLRAMANDGLGNDDEALADARAALDLAPKSTTGPVWSAQVWLSFRNRLDADD